MPSARRPMNWTEKLLADHADLVYADQCIHHGRREVEASRWWYGWELFADAMRSLILRVEGASEIFADPLDTRDRIRDHGPNGGTRGFADQWEEPRQ